MVLFLEDMDMILDQQICFWKKLNRSDFGWMDMILEEMDRILEESASDFGSIGS